jgi:rRNA maturation RNase YbeY
MVDAGSEALSVEVDVLTETELTRAFDLDRLSALATHVLVAEGRTGRWAVTIALVDDERLRVLHRDFMGIDAETDVMTFPLSGEDEPAALGGDIAVSVDRAAEQGPEHGLTTEEEVRFLVVHGLLHLCGWDDSGAGSRARMLARQTELVGEFDRGRSGAAT